MQNYDAFIWIPSNFLKDINYVLIRDNLDNGSDLPMFFEAFIIKYWKGEFFNISLVYASLLATSNGDFKIKFFDKGLNSQFDSSKFNWLFYILSFR